MSVQLRDGVACPRNGSRGEVSMGSSVRTIPAPAPPPGKDGENSQRLASAFEEASRAASGGRGPWLPGPARAAARFATPKLERLLQKLLPAQRKFNSSILEAVRTLTRDWQEEGHRMRQRIDATERRLDALEEGAAR